MDSDSNLPNRALITRNSFKELNKKHSVFSSISQYPSGAPNQKNSYSIGTLFLVTPIIGISKSHSEFLKNQGYSEKNESGASIKAQIIENNRFKGPFSIFKGCAVNFVQTMDIPLSERYQLGFSISAYNPKNPSIQQIGVSVLHFTDSNVLIKV
jgi:hypothetical protein